MQSFELWFSNVSKYPLPNNERVYCQTNNHHSHVVTFISVLEISDIMILYRRNYQNFSCCDKTTKCLTKTTWDHSHDFTITLIGNFSHQFYITSNMHHQLCFQDLNLYFYPVSVCVSVWYGSYLLIHIESITPFKVFSPNF